MKNNIKKHDAYKTIGETAKELSLIDKKTGHLQTHTIRYWETQFKQINPSIRVGGRRYYSKKDIKIINYIKFLLKEKGFTVNGVKKILNEDELRILKRDFYRTKDQIEHIIKSQLTDKESFEKADYILENNEKSLLLPEVIDLYEKIRKKVC